MPFFILAGVTAAASIGSAVIGSQGAQDAANTQGKASQAAQDRLQQNYQQTVQNEQPYQQFGSDSLNALRQAMGLSPGSSGGTPNGFLSTPATAQQYQQSPGYQFQLDQGLNAVENRATTQGGIGGNQLKALMGYGQGLANSDYQQFVSNIMAEQNQLYGELGGGVNVGQGANTTVANAGQNTATNVANLITSNGANQAAAGVAGTNALTGALNTGANAFTSNYLLSQLNGGTNAALNATSSYGPLDLNGLANQQPAYNYATMGG